MGTAILNEQTPLYLPPKQNAAHLQAILSILQSAKPSHGGSLAAQIRAMVPRMRRRGLFVLFSDCCTCLTGDETVFVIDNSMSTLRKSEDATLFAKLIERATEELNDIAPGDSVRVLLASPYPVWAMAGDVRVDSGSRTLVVEQLKDIQPTNGSSDLLAAMFTAVQADADQNTQKRRIVLLTDGQAADWKTSDTSGWQRFQEVLKSASIPTQLDVIELGAKTPKSTNIAVNNVRFNRLVTGIGQTLYRDGSDSEPFRC